MIPPRWSLPVVAVAGLTLASATFLLCRSVDDAPLTGETPKSQSPTVSLFTLPVELTGISDLRAEVLPAGLALLLLVLGWRPLRAPGPAGVTYRRGAPEAGLRGYWLEFLAAAALGWAVLSTLRAGTWGLSRGWLLGLGCGSGWAVLLARTADLRTVRRVLMVAAAVAAAACGLSLWNRQVLGIEMFDFPVGPITLLGGLASAWAAGSIGGALAAASATRRRPRRAWPVLAALLALAGPPLSLLVAANRRTAWLGLVGAAALVAGLLILARLRSRPLRMGLLTAVMAGLAFGVWRVLAISHELDPSLAGRFSARLIYWGRAAAMLPDRWFVGYGPDMFACEMTTALAPDRAASPRILRGSVDFDAHSEWIQAVFELGIPGGLLYLSMPLVALVLACRALVRIRSWRRRGLLAACACGLAAVVVGEAASINLRYATLPPWYWTLLGLTAALVRPGARRRSLPAEPAAVARMRRVAAAAVAVALAAFAAMDLHHVRAHALGRAAIGRDDALAAARLEQGICRLGAANWLIAHRDLGNALLNLIRRRGPMADSRPAGEAAAVDRWAARAVEVLADLHRRCPAYPAAAFRYAEALMFAGRPEEAAAVLDRHLREVNPYDSQANMLFLTVARPPAETALACLRRAVRDSGWDATMERNTAACFAARGVLDLWLPQARRAREDLASPRPPEEWQDPLAPETLRIEAARLHAAGQSAEAARAQLLAADACLRLARERSARRRPALAESDACLRAAQFLLEASPLQYGRAYSLVSTAERLVMPDSIFGAPEEGAESLLVDLRDLDARYPGRLGNLWMFSALLHLMTAQPAEQTDLRLWLSLPADRRTPAEMDALRRQLAAGIILRYQELPASARPPGYDVLQGLSPPDGHLPAAGAPLP
jgi:O-antigen ligase